MSLSRALASFAGCEDVRGSCLYRRQDIPLQVQVAAP